MRFIEMVFIGIMMFFISMTIVDCSSKNSFNQNMLKMNLAHYDQKTGEFILDSLSCHNDSCIIFRK